MDDISKLMTEQVNDRSVDIETQSIGQILHYMNDENRTVTDAIERCIPSIEKVTAAVVQAFEKGGRLIYLGAGTSGRLGVLDASECPPTFGVSPDMVVGVIAGGDYALRHAIEGAEDDETIAKEQLKQLGLVKEDVVVGISASGRTPYVVAGLSYAKEVGCYTGAISNSPNAVISNVADIGIEAITGPEVVTGSTRMKAGTAQKLILNMITTAAMIRVGKIFKGYMVDVQPTNQKLKQRATNILSKITGFSQEEARAHLEKNDFDLKVAIISQIHHISSNEARKMLRENQMNIVKAMQNKEA
ncbi:MAG: N-acetylmuramic acid 6-phosphate etherase [Carnobacterium sp.]|nr:N-acetylmuramic acid 6-phosphate etherase [Carnobacterium sp.]